MNNTFKIGRQIQQTRFDKLDSNYTISKGRVVITINGQTFTGAGEIKLELLPKSGIYIYVYLTNIPLNVAMSVIQAPDAIESLTYNNQKIDGIRLSVGGDAPTGELNIKWAPIETPVEMKHRLSSDIKSIDFQLFNFQMFIGNRGQELTNGAIVQTIDLEHDDLKIEIRNIRGITDNTKYLKENGGYRLTQKGTITRPSGGSFSTEETNNILYMLRNFLSFAKGRLWVPVCPIGYSSHSTVEYESWTHPTTQWQNNLSWYDPMAINQLQPLFSKFADKFFNPAWHDAFHEIIYWYLNANNSSRGIDAGIILTQAALERLSFEYLVNDQHLLSKTQYKKLPTSDKYNKLFTSLSIPLDIPPTTPKLNSLAQSPPFNWPDAPTALTKIRNSLVHPQKTNQDQISEAYFDTWNLGLWYLEMGILAICGYSGHYSNRLKRSFSGTVEKVPWT